MKVLLIFLAATLFVAIRGVRHNRPVRTLPLLVASAVVATAFFLSLRVV